MAYGHMLDMARKALLLVQGKIRGDCDRDEPPRLALVHLIQVIGEAARHVSPVFCDRHPQIPWKAIIAMRHRVVHDYMSVDEDVVWDTVSQELRPLVTALEKIVPPAAH